LRVPCETPNGSSIVYRKSKIVKALQLIAHGVPGKFELRDLPEPQPSPDEVVVQVQSCGLNHIDLWLEEAGLPMPMRLPRPGDSL
jgi:NADPH:quinone reductase-like Zn-dependent oxidoreductase